MNTFHNKITRRIFAGLAWLVLVAGVVVTITGFIVGSASPTSAQQEADAVAEQDADEASEQTASAEVDEESADGENAPPPPAEDEASTDSSGDGVPAENAESADDPEADGTDPARGPPEGEESESGEDESAGEETDSQNAESDEGSDSAEGETVALGERESETPFHQRALSFLGIIALLFIAWLLSNNRAKVNWRIVGVGVGLQLTFALFIFYVPGGELIFEVATKAFAKILEFTDNGSEFIFESVVTQEWEPGLRNFAFAVLPTIIFFSSLMTILYHLGIMQKLVHGFAKVMQKTMNLSGAESTSAAANIFVGQTEAPLVVKPFIEDMTMSELMVVMTGGFATVAGGVLAVYVGMLEQTFPDIAGHLIAASVMSAPAALVVAKIMYPETGTPETMGELEVREIGDDVNVLDAASRGAGEGLKLALNVAAMLLAFLALIAMINYLIGLPSLLYNEHFVLSDLVDYYNQNDMAIPDGCAPAEVVDDDVKGCIDQMQGAAGGAAAEAWVAPMITMQDIFGWIFWPFAFIMGVPVEDCFTIARLLGEKMVVNELVAYASLQQLLMDSEVVLQERSVIIATYALCGFANFGSIGIQLGGIGGIAPNRKGDLAKIALKAMIGGTLAAFMTATIAGILV